MTGIGLVALCLLLPGIAAAHEGVPRILVEPAQAPPGGVVTIRLEDLPREQVIDLSVAGTTGSMPLTSVQVDPEGHATIYMELPVDLPTGEYVVEASVQGVPETAIPDAVLSVAGTPVVQPGEPAEKDEDDPLLVALPSDWRRSLSGPIVTAQPLTETLPAGSASRAGIETLVGWVALGFGIAVAAAVLLIRFLGRRRGSTSGS